MAFASLRQPSTISIDQALIDTASNNTSLERHPIATRGGPLPIFHSPSLDSSYPRDVVGVDNTDRLEEAMRLALKSNNGLRDNGKEQQVEMLQCVDTPFGAEEVAKQQRKDRENLEPRKPAQPSKNYKHKRDPLPASYYTKMHKHKIPVPKTYFPSWAQKEKSDDISLDREIVNNEPLGQVKTEVSSTSEHQNIEGAEEAKQKAFLNCDTDIIIFEEYIKMGLGTRRIKERN